MNKLTARDDITTQLVFVRHGESYGNLGLPTPDDYSKEDTPLTEYGMSQAQALADYWFDGVEIAHIYASPFSRTIQTIYPTAQKLGKKIELMPDLLEYGSTTAGCETERIEKDFPLAIPCKGDTSPAGGTMLLPVPESYEQAQARAGRFIKYVKSIYQSGETVIVSTHGTFFSYLVRAALNADGKESFNSQIDNSAITVVALRKDNAPLLQTANNTSHLRTK